MYKMKLKIFIAAVLLIFFYGCGNCGCGDGDKLQLQIEIQKLDAWFDLMPGGAPSFHFAGDLIIKNISDDPVKSLLLRVVKVFQDGKELYSISPEFSPISQDDDKSIAGESEKTFLFNTSKKIPIKDEMDMQRQIEMHLLFSDEGKEFIFKIENLTVEYIY